jgi:F420-0:gamma-glutamyl ligase-like protein
MVFLAGLSLDISLHRTQALCLCLVWINRGVFTVFVPVADAKETYLIIGYNHPGLPLSQPVYEIEACTGVYRILAERLYNMVKIT